jgi:uncharacterized membrane protein (Fun14 family)
MIPPEFAWVIPIIVPFIIGLLIGVIVKKTFKLALTVLVLIIILAALGYIAMPSIRELVAAAAKLLPKFQEQLGPLINVLPYSSVTFIIGLILGLLKG